MKCVDFIESQLGCKEDEIGDDSKTVSCSSSSSTLSSISPITSNKENVKRKNTSPNQKTHHKVNKLNTLSKQTQKFQNSIPNYYCKMKRKHSARTKSI